MHADIQCSKAKLWYLFQDAIKIKPEPLLINAAAELIKTTKLITIATNHGYMIKIRALGMCLQ